LFEVSDYAARGENHKAKEKALLIFILRANCTILPF